MPDPTPAPLPASRSALRPWLLLLIPAVTATFFVLFTRETWEDFYITIRHTENLVNGNGLVYQPGERVHGFTSVINVLLPALPLAATGSLDAALWIYRFCSLGVLLAGLHALWRAQRLKLGSTGLEMVLSAIAVGFGIKIVAFTMNGQETGFLVGFLAWSVAMALRFDEPGREWKLGLTWTGLLYTRPDSPLYIALVAGLIWWLHGGPGRLGALFRGVVAAGIVSGLLFAPWVLFTWVYYGSPIPHTITAKAADSLLEGGSTLRTFVAFWGQLPDSVSDVFGPVYGIWHWPSWLGWGMMILGWIACLAWAHRGADRFTRGCSIALVGSLLYVTWLGVQRTAYPWYYGPAGLFGAIVLSRLGASAWQNSLHWKRPVAGLGIAIGVVFLVVTFGMSARLLRIQQREIELGTRKEIGLWLRQNVAPGETVYLEPLGYIGYFSGAHMLDFPGLVSPSVVKARQETKADFGLLPHYLKPTWIVVRPGELEALKVIPNVEKTYEVKQVFNVSEKLLAQYGHVPGIGMARYDSAFAVLKRLPGIDQP